MRWPSSSRDGALLSSSRFSDKFFGGGARSPTPFVLRRRPERCRSCSCKSCLAQPLVSRLAPGWLECPRPWHIRQGTGCAPRKAVVPTDEFVGERLVRSTYRLPLSLDRVARPAIPDELDAGPREEGLTVPPVAFRLRLYGESGISNYVDGATRLRACTNRWKLAMRSSFRSRSTFPND